MVAVAGDGGNFRISARHNAVVIENNPAIERLGIPHHSMQLQGTEIMIVPHKPDTAKLLRNLGYMVPSPIINRYDWAHETPFESQVTTAAMLTLHRRAYVLNDMGCGKSLAALFAFDFLKKMAAATRMMVVAPLSTLYLVWAAEVFKRLPHLRVSIVYGTRKQRLAALEEDADIYIINHDGLKTLCEFYKTGRRTIVRLGEALKDRNDIDTIVIDELATYRNRRTDRWKTAKALLEGKKWGWGLTGSPTPKEPTDAYGQVMLLTPERAPASFRSLRDQTMTQITQFKWLPKPNALETVHKMMQPAVRFKRSDCVDLPPTTYSDREVELSAVQQRAFKEMVTRLVTVHKGEKVVALNEGIKLGKLLQIVCGFIYGNTRKTGKTGNPLDFDCETDEVGLIDTGTRISVLKEVIEQSEGKVIVFAPFKRAVALIADELKGEVSFTTITGETSSNERTKRFHLFQHSPHPRVLIAHPKVMSHGLNLTAASTTVWYAPFPDLEIYEQANARTPRPGQKMHTHIIHLTSTATEQRVYKVLKDRGNLQATLLNMFANNKSLDSYVKMT